MHANAFTLNGLICPGKPAKPWRMIRTSIPSRFAAIVGVAAGVAALSVGESAFAATYQVGPSKPFKQLGDVAPQLAPGDVVEVDGDATYSSVSLSKNGSPQSKITIRGIKRNGKRPVIKGGTNTIAIHGSHYVLEGLDVTGGSARCVFHHANDVTVRDTVVHDCPAHGILGADTESGSLTLDRVEVYRSGEGTRKHQIYVATDERMYPNAVFRMQHSYVHDSNGGNSVKSRAGRNEIYYNWIEGGTYHELELIGSEEFPTNLLREDSDVVGNVLRKTKGAFAVRFGGDGSGETKGRYRFVNNTVIADGGTKYIFRLFDGLESVEMHNNVFASASATPFTLIRDVEAKWAKGHPIVTGSNNWVPTGMKTPAQWTKTIAGSDPGFVNASALDYSPASGSALRNAGNNFPSSSSAAPFPNPLATASFIPPSRTIQAPQTRANDGAIDIGALEVGSRQQSKRAFSLEEQLDEDEMNLAEMEAALTDAYATGEPMACSVGSGRSRSLAAPTALVGFAVFAALRRRKRSRR